MIKLKTRVCITLLIILMLPVTKNGTAQLEKYNVKWDSPSEDSWGSMPIGNGDIGANLWITPDGEIHFYISKIDAFSENGRLLKIGKLSVRFTPNIMKGADFMQELDLESGTIKISGQKNNKNIQLSFWIDANNPVISLDGQSSVPVKAEVVYEGWRNERRELSKDEMSSAYGLTGSPEPVVVTPDVIGSVDDGLFWYHRNNKSIWGKTIEIQALEYANSIKDPLKDRTFGAYVYGNGLIKDSDKKLISKESSKEIQIAVFPFTVQTETVNSLNSEVLEMVKNIEQKSLTQRKKEHINWWQSFWKSHYIFVESSKKSEAVHSMTRGYLLQRFMNASAGRGAVPIKFNGSIFTVDVPRPVKKTFGFDADYRDWGPCYWWQNTRLPYWAMLYSGDFELMKPLFEMYVNALPMAKFRAEKYYKHKGAMYPETMYFWGTWNNENYGWDREGKPDGLSDNKYIRYEWQGAIELTDMMLDYYSFTKDADFLENTLVPFANEILTFYDLHYKRDAKGKIKFDPAQALETYWEGTINPMPEVAGLTQVCNKLLELDEKLLKKAFKQLVGKLQNELPQLPVAEVKGKKVLLPAEVLGPKRNQENPELYAVFPYRQFGVGKPDIEIAINTYEARIHKAVHGWQQDGIQAALLGLKKEAADIVLNNFNTKHKGSRFPAFWGPNYDWVPDQCHGGVNMRALQNMLIQTDGKKILMFPAWPEKWDVEFKVHAPENTTIEGKLENGKLINLKVTPSEREKDIVNYLR
jgi:alpha-L-fucosidase 2